MKPNSTEPLKKIYSRGHKSAPSTHFAPTYVSGYLNSFRSRQKGFMVVSLIIFLALMSLYVTTNIRNLALLKRELQLIEQKQIQHWRK
jgi:hypothetical protein